MKANTAKVTPLQKGLKAIIEGLRGDIYSGIRLPRERLLESELASAFSVSRIVVRQALDILQAEGLVTTQPNKGASVAEISLVRISENYQIYAMMEGTAAMLATRNLDASDIDALEANLQQQCDLDIDNIQEWQKLNHAFHRMINLKCGNRRLIELIKAHSQFTSYWFIVLSAPGRIPHNIKDHESVLKAFEKGRAEEARRNMESHIIQNGKHLMAFMRKNVPPGVWQEG